jgi:uncharacterized protein (TIGR04255 family)
VRYASVLNHAEKLNEILKYNPRFNIDGFEEDLVLIRSDLKRNKWNLHLQIAKNAKVDRLGSVKNGTLVDIDASYTATIDLNDHIFEIIDGLHSEQKFLFFELLTPESLTKLNPEY